MASSTKVWFAVELLGIGGISRGLLQWIKGVKEHVDVDFTVVCRSAGGGIHSDEMSKYARVFAPKDDAEMLARLASERPDTFVINGVASYVKHVPAIRSVVRRLVCVVHSLAEWSLQFLKPGVREHYACVVVVAPYQIEQAVCAGVPRERVRCVRNRLDLSAFSPLPRLDCRRALGLPDGAFIFGYAGRACGGKRTSMLPRVLWRLRGVGVNAHMALGGLYEAGFGENSAYWQRALDDLKLQARSLHVDEHMTILPASPSMASFYSALDASILLSNAEGSPLVVRESLACGVPIVTTAVGDVADVAIPETGSAIIQEGGSQRNQFSFHAWGDVSHFATLSLLYVAKRTAESRDEYALHAQKFITDTESTSRWDAEMLPVLLEVLGVSQVTK